MAIPFPNRSLLHNGSACAQLAVAAYYGDGYAVGWDYVKPLKNSNAAGLVGWHRDSGVSFIAIAGTNDALDAINDADTRKVALPDGTRVHSGFLHYAESVLNAIRLLRIKGHLTRRKLFIVGHSLGGAAAEILPLIEPTLAPEQIHTFGSPRWCASNYALQYPYETTHWRRPLDVVPDVPLHLRHARFLRRVSGFSHVRGQAAYLTADAVTPDTGHIARRIQRAGCYAAATLGAFAAFTTPRCLPGRVTLEVIRRLNRTAADHHSVRDYWQLLEKHREVQSALSEIASDVAAIARDHTSVED